MLTARFFSSAGRGRQSGLSLVELMVGVAVGLIIVAGATVVASTQLSDTRHLTLEMQVNQDLRATADIVTRSLRQAGSWNGAASVIWTPAVTSAATNPNLPINVTTSGTNQSILFSSSSGSVAGTGFQVSGSPGVLQVWNGTAWQSLTDSYSLNITNFQITQVATPSGSAASATLACSAACSGGGTACWPSVGVTELQIYIQGNAISDPNIVRSVTTHIRVRNDQITNNNAGGPLCPT